MTSCIDLFQQKQFSLVKSVKKQISYFSYIQPSTITLCKNLHDHQLCFFTPFIFTRNQQLFKIKQEDHIPSMLTGGLVFFLSRECQHKINKIRITTLSFPQLKLCILQDINYFKTTYLAQFNSPRKIPQIVSFIFLSNSTLHYESNKILFTQFRHS